MAAATEGAPGGGSLGEEIVAAGTALEVDVMAAAG